MNYKFPQRMEVWYADLPLNKDSFIQGGKRPVLILSNNICNERNHILTVIPMTHQIKKLHLPMHVVVEESPTGGDSLVLVEQITTIEKKLLGSWLGTLKRRDRRAVEAVVREHLGLGR